MIGAVDYVKYPTSEKGKPVERRGRKAMDPQPPGKGQDSQVAEDEPLHMFVPGPLGQARILFCPATIPRSGDRHKNIKKKRRYIMKVQIKLNKECVK